MRDLLLELFGDLFFDFVNENTYQYALAGLNLEVPIAPPTLRVSIVILKIISFFSN